MASAQCVLGLPVIDQIINKQSKRYQDHDREKLKKDVEISCNRFDKKGKGRLNAKDLYNVLKLQNKLETSVEEIEKLIVDLDCDRDGRVSVKDFMRHPVISQAVFDSMDKNKDGRVSKGELKLAAKGISMRELIKIINDVDKNNDGQLTFEEVKAISKKAYDTQKASSSSSSSSHHSSSSSSTSKSTSKSSSSSRSDHHSSSRSSNHRSSSRSKSRN